MDRSRIIALVLLVMATFLYTEWLNNRVAERQRYLKAQQLAAKAIEERAAKAPAAPATSATTAAPTDATPAKTAATPAADAAEGTAKAITITTPEFEAVFSTKGAALVKYTLLNHYRTSKHTPETRQVLLDELAPGSASLRVREFGADVNVNTWAILSAKEVDARHYHVTAEPMAADGVVRQGELAFETVVDQWRIRKVFTFDPKWKHGFGVRVVFENTADAPRPIVWRMDAVSGLVPDSGDTYFGTMQALSAKGEAEALVTLPVIDRQKGGPHTENGPLAWFGLRNRFFGTFLRLETPAQSAEMALTHLPVAAGYGQSDAELAAILKAHPYSAATAWRGNRATCAPKATEETRFVFYGGPMSEEALAFDPVYANAISYSWHWFDGISRMLVTVLLKMETVIPNYGLCIILLTIIIKTLLHGLTRQAIRGQHEMQKVQPLMNALKQKYANDRQKLQMETMRLYREHGINPFKSCLPIFLQIPIFIALYGTFARAFAMRQAAFIPGWIDDLSLPDRFFTLPFSLPFIGSDLNLLPVIYVAFQLWQQSMTPKSSDPTVAQQQAMMKIMPVVFMFIFYGMPAGLLLYFTVQAAYTLVEHWFLTRQLKTETATAAATEAATPVRAGQGFGKKKK